MLKDCVESDALVKSGQKAYNRKDVDAVAAQKKTFGNFIWSRVEIWRVEKYYPFNIYLRVFV